jgi:hypothetical protein
MVPGPRRRPCRVLVDRSVGVPECCCERRARCVPCCCPPQRLSQPTGSWRDHLMEPLAAASVPCAERARRWPGPGSRHRPAVVSSSGTPGGFPGPRQAACREGRFGFRLVRVGGPHGGGRVCGCWSRPDRWSQPGGRGRPRPRSRAPRGCTHRAATGDAPCATYFLRWTPVRWPGGAVPAVRMKKYRATLWAILVWNRRSSSGMKPPCLHPEEGLALTEVAGLRPGDGVTRVRR